MKIVLFVEGHTEHQAVAAFLKRWLDIRLDKPVGVQTVRFEGWPELVASCANQAQRHLNGPKADVIAVLALLDLYGPTFYPSDKITAAARYKWAKVYLEEKVDQTKFSQHFAVHETEAWLLSDPFIFPAEVKKALEGKYPRPEIVNFDTPPAMLLERLYSSKTGRQYKKVTNGKELFAKLDPAVAYDKCPSLKALLDEMLLLSQQAGLS